MKTAQACAALVLGAAMSVGAMSTASAYFNGREYRGGFVKPCSLDGVNPVFHPDIFGNPLFARDVYGFVQARDGSWHVMANCHLYN
jgi:hypothetical protein